MDNLGYDLYHIFALSDDKMSKPSVFHLGLCLVHILEMVHSAGYIYNDLKLDNVVV